MAATMAAFVTGSSRGIGLGAALDLAGRGYNIALNCRKQNDEIDAAADAVAKLGVKVVKAPFSVADIDLHDAAVDRIEAEIGPLTTLVNNAGVGALSRGDLLDATPESYDHVMGINARAMFFLSQAVAKRMVARERDPDVYHSIVNVSSVSAVTVSENRGEYCASKAAAAMISQVFAVRLGRENIHVFDVQPGLIETDMTAKVADVYRERAKEGLTLMPRLGTPAEIGKVIGTLASGGIPYTTGQVIRPDAGLAVPRF